MSSKTEALLHFDESAIKDECGNIWNYYNNNDERLSTFSKFGKNSLAYPCLINRNMDSSSCIYTKWFTVDFWVYYAPDRYIETYPVKIMRGTLELLTTHIYPYDSNLYVYMSSYSSRDISAIVSRGTIPQHEWCHIAIVRDDTTFYFFINGNCTSSITNESKLIKYSSNNTILIGANSNIDEFRISTYPVWTKNFTPPNSAYSLSNKFLYKDNNDCAWGMIK